MKRRLLSTFGGGISEHRTRKLQQRTGTIYVHVSWVHTNFHSNCCVHSSTVQLPRAAFHLKKCTQPALSSWSQGEIYLAQTECGGKQYSLVPSIKCGEGKRAWSTLLCGCRLDSQTLLYSHHILCTGSINWCLLAFFLVFLVLILGTEATNNTNSPRRKYMLRPQYRDPQCQDHWSLRHIDVHYSNFRHVHKLQVEDLLHHLRRDDRCWVI